MAEIDFETKQTLSHRGRALAAPLGRLCDKNPRKGDGETRKPHESPVFPGERVASNMVGAVLGEHPAQEIASRVAHAHLLSD
jgi:hypothetical protein